MLFRISWIRGSFFFLESNHRLHFSLLVSVSNFHLFRLMVYSGKYKIMFDFKFEGSGFFFIEQTDFSGFVLFAGRVFVSRYFQFVADSVCIPIRSWLLWDSVNVTHQYMMRAKIEVYKCFHKPDFASLSLQCCVILQKRPQLLRCFDKSIFHRLIYDLFNKFPNRKKNNKQPYRLLWSGDIISVFCSTPLFIMFAKASRKYNEKKMPEKKSTKVNTHYTILVLIFNYILMEVIPSLSHA